MRDQCTCTDCAESRGVITKVDGSYTAEYIVHTLTKKHEELNAWEGDVCELDHDHPKSKSCSEQYLCDGCGTYHETTDEAEECCAGWECNVCGYTYTRGGWYSSPKSQAASCCVSSCSDCGVSGWANMIETHECENSTPRMRNTPPWVERGNVIDARYPDLPWKKAWDLDPEKYNVVQAAADYYLLEAIKAGLVGTTDGKGNKVVNVEHSTVFRIITDEAQDMFNTLVKLWDPILQAYTHIAVGGELRHHSALGGVLSGTRQTAWGGWKEIFNTVGPQALQDAADLFMEFTGGSFGGQKWADAASILHSRLIGKLNPAMFLDRIFNAQHNGGCLLNKVKWAGDKVMIGGYRVMPLNDLTYKVLPAHGVDPEPDYTTLLTYASSEVQRLFADSYKYAGVAAHSMGVTLQGRRIRPTRGELSYIEAQRKTKEAEAKAAAEHKKPKSVKLKDKLAQYEEQVAKAYPAYEAHLKAMKVAKKAAVPACGCGISSCSANIPGYDSYAKETYDYWVKMVKDMEQKIINHNTWIMQYGPEKPACEECGWFDYCGCPPAPCTGCGMLYCECWDEEPDYNDDDECSECGGYYPNCPC